MNVLKNKTLPLTDITFDRAFLVDFAKTFFVGMFVVIGTFPESDWVYSWGIDPPLAWVFNYLFENGLDMGKDIIFPHGPLAFFMYPLPENILIATLVTCLLKFLLVYSLANLLANNYSKQKWLLTFFTAAFLSIILSFNHLILANLILLYCNIYLQNKNSLRLIAYVITAFSFYVKAYVAIITGVMFVSFVFYEFFRNRNVKHLLINSAVLLGALLCFWLAMYGTFSGFFRYVWGMFNLAQDNSSAASYYPYNNWGILTLFFVLLIILTVINRTRKAHFFVILIGFSLFAAWKHGMAREDIYHIKGFFIYLLTCLFIFVLFNQKNIYNNLALSIVTLFLFSLNMTNAFNYTSSKYELFRSNNFIRFITDFSKLKDNSGSTSQKNISDNKLPQNIIDSISNSTVDVYPWDYSIIAANNFNWQPRVVLHSYAAYTSWLDKQNASHFNSNNAPSFFIIEKIGWENINGGIFTSIDHRYLFNDEPQTILEILRNYEFYYSNNKFLVLKKRQYPVTISKNIIGSKKTTWGEWVKVPKHQDDLLRTKIEMDRSFLQKTKSFLYKDEQFWIYLKLDNDQIHKYRIVPKNAKDGLWIAPYIFTQEKIFNVKEICFKASNQAILKKEIKLQWESIKTPLNNVTHGIFNHKAPSIDSCVFVSKNNFEKESLKNWEQHNETIISNNVFEGERAQLLRAGSFSSTFSVSLDSIPSEKVMIKADCWVKSPTYKYSGNVFIVISIEKEGQNIAWKSLSIDRQLIDRKQWNNVLRFIEYNNVKPGCTLKVYIWNKSDKEVVVDNFRLVVEMEES